MKKGCELCDGTARMYCESDQASLCWDCDARVHGANFLVARHTRCLLCRRCQSPTPWRADGQRLFPTAAVCDRCYAAGAKISATSDADDDVDDDDEEEEEEDEDEEDEDEGDEEGEEEREEEDGENQVVPWTLTPPPPPSASSSSSEDSSSRTSNGSLKRMREHANLDNGAGSSAQLSYLALEPAGSPLNPVQAPGEDEAMSFASTSLTSRDYRALCIRNRRDDRTVHLVSSSSHTRPI